MNVQSSPVNWRRFALLTLGYGLTDTVAKRFDIGVRWGDQVAKDMIAVRIGHDARLAIAGSLEYPAHHPAPKHSKDLLNQNSIKLRLPTLRGVPHAWELKRGARNIQVRVDGQFTFNGAYQTMNAAIDGAGLAFVSENLAEPHVAARRLRWVLPDWEWKCEHGLCGLRNASEKIGTHCVSFLPNICGPSGLMCRQ
ncbi:LysR substrate-binding domain-containing protein [Paraburkholderia bannensis]|uniref:LysR substrate-binding domain-containing protein n=1 Tax=Paraburkholderia bannensis TaxID=765414 RepID=UPI002AB7EF81|nr:LysR substrate-binding domain-containing protein [Paraburkholderia bannensis]